MTALVILAFYGAVGAVAAVGVLARRRGESVPSRLGQALLALGLWPFLLPVLLAPGEAPVRAGDTAESERTRRLEEAVGRLEASWRQVAVESTWAAEPAREHRLLEGFTARLRAQERRLREMEEALATAPASVKERLTRLYEHAGRELEHGIGLVEELSAQLTLLRFADLGNPSAGRVERRHIEELLLRIESLAEASQPLGGEPHEAQTAQA
jgi:hypothetical protein